jgi:hypothetical protein
MPDVEKHNAPSRLAGQAGSVADGQGNVGGTDSEAPEPQAQEGIEHTKRFATLRAYAGLAGWTLAFDGHCLTASRWGQTRILASLDAAELFFRKIGVLS